MRGLRAHRDGGEGVRHMAEDAYSWPHVKVEPFGGHVHYAQHKHGQQHGEGNQHEESQGGLSGSKHSEQHDYASQHVQAANDGRHFSEGVLHGVQELRLERRVMKS